MEQVLSLLSQQAVTMALCIPACTRQPPQDAWQPGHLSFQLVISGEIPTTPWHADQETIVQAGGLICCAAHAASTRRYDVDRKHLAFSVIGNQLHVHLYQRKATDPIGKGQEQRWQLQAPSAMSSLSQLIERGFREGLDASSLNHLAMSAPGILWQSLQQRGQTQMQRALDWLQEHACDDLSRDDLAAHLDCHPDHVTRLFRQTGMASFADERKRLRCEMACELLNDEGLPLSEIARRCGFNSETYFIRSFKQMYAMTPGSWRRRQDFGT